jgi:hypothetical protein
MYEISKLINQVISGNKQRKREIVLKLGYKNLDKGYRRLHHLIETGECSEPMKRMLPNALGLDPQVVEDAFEATVQQKAVELELARKRREENERGTFRPHIWIEHELSRPRSITIVAFTGVENYKVVRLPENTNKLSWDEQKRIVRWTIRQHQDDKGTVDPMFGSVTGYIYRQTYDDSHLFSRDGELLTINYGKFERPECSLRIGNKVITGGLLKMVKIKPDNL